MSWQAPVVKIICEGSTERAFVREVLRPRYLAPSGPRLFLKPLVIGEAAGRSSGGGNVTAGRLIGDIIASLKDPEHHHCTTLVDYYGRSGTWPDDAQVSGGEPATKAVRIERAIEQEVTKRLGPSFDSRRLRCYFSMHELEALCFSHPETAGEILGGATKTGALQRIVQEFESPERINDDPRLAPSKRLKAIASSYSKTRDTIAITRAIGLPAMIAACPHFADWIDWFDSIAAGEPSAS